MIFRIKYRSNSKLQQLVKAIKLKYGHHVQVLPMSRTLSIEIPDEIYQTFLQTAQRLGQSPEATVSQWIVTQHQAADPLDAFIGAFNSEIPDWTSRHNEYLGVALLETHDKP